MTPVDLDAIVGALFELSDVELSGVAEAVAAEQRSRASAQGDLSALVDDVFRTGFDSQGMARAPWLVGGVLVCPGSKVGATPASHRCRFVAIGDAWVWESRDVLLDEMRQVGNGRTHTVTLIAAFDGLEGWTVTSKARSGRHERQQADGFRVEGGQLVTTEIRAKVNRPHR